MLYVIRVVCADTPAACQVRGWAWFTSCFGCQQCNFQGATYEKAVRFLGYSEPFPQYILHGEHYKLYANEGIRYDQKTVHRLYDMYEEDPNVLGPFCPFKNVSALRHCPAFDVTRSIYVPYWHKLFEGVVQTFFKALFKVFDKKHADEVECFQDLIRVFQSIIVILLYLISVF